MVLKTFQVRIRGGATLFSRYGSYVINESLKACIITQRSLC